MKNFEYRIVEKVTHSGSNYYPQYRKIGSWIFKGWKSFEISNISKATGLISYRNYSKLIEEAKKVIDAHIIDAKEVTIIHKYP